MDKAIPLNIESFNLLTGQVLSELYQAFPCEVELEGIRIALTVSQKAGDVDTEELEKLHAIADDTISFLIEEGFVRSRGSDGTYRQKFVGCRLTIRGLAILGSVPLAVDESKDKRSLGLQLGEAIEEGSKGAVGELVGKAFTSIIQLGAGAIGNILT